MNRKAFTLLEVLLTVTLIAAISTVTISILPAAYARSSLDVAKDQVISSLHKAYTFSRAMHNDSAWGVNIQADTVTVFAGDSYAARNTTLDIVAEISGGVDFSGISEIVFEKVTGQPQSTGTINVTSDGNTETVSVNTYGTINY